MRGLSLVCLLLFGCGRILGLDDYEVGDAGADATTDATLDASRDTAPDTFDASFDAGVDAFDAGPVLQQLALGEDHTCLMTDTQIYCWGSNEFGQLGTDTSDRETLPITVPIDRIDLGESAQLIAGHNNTCVIASDGAVSCWGAGMQGQLGTGSAAPDTHASRALGITVDELVIGFDSMCAVERESTCPSSVVCWGNDDLGRLGRGTNDGIIRNIGCATTPMALSALAGKDNHYCSLSGAVPWCWGLNDLRQVRNDPSLAVLTPDEAIGAGEIPDMIRQVAVGVSFSCALDTNDEVRCWGGGGQGQLGDGTMSQRMTYPAAAIRFDGEARIRQIVAGRAHVCALDVDDRVHCWGQKIEGRVGIGDRDGLQLTPALLRTLPAIRSIAAGDAHMCAISTINELWCWGRNREGQIGDASVIHVLSPKNISVTSF